MSAALPDESPAASRSASPGWAVSASLQRLRGGEAIVFEANLTVEFALFVSAGAPTRLARFLGSDNQLRCRSVTGATVTKLDTTVGLPLMG
jgi:hypothetical protein